MAPRLADPSKAGLHAVVAVGFFLGRFDRLNSWDILARGRDCRCCRPPDRRQVVGDHRSKCSSSSPHEKRPWSGSHGHLGARVELSWEASPARPAGSVLWAQLGRPTPTSRLLGSLIRAGLLVVAVVTVPAIIVESDLLVLPAAALMLLAWLAIALVALVHWVLSVGAPPLITTIRAAGSAGWAAVGDDPIGRRLHHLADRIGGLTGPARQPGRWFTGPHPPPSRATATQRAFLSRMAAPARYRATGPSLTLITTSRRPSPPSEGDNRPMVELLHEISHRYTEVTSRGGLGPKPASPRCQAAAGARWGHVKCGTDMARSGSEGRYGTSRLPLSWPSPATLSVYDKSERRESNPRSQLGMSNPATPLTSADLHMRRSECLSRPSVSAPFAAVLLRYGTDMARHWHENHPFRG